MILKEMINSILLNNKLHAKWLNSLAYMEHIGSRKIIKSHNSQLLDLETLQHISEEARHAYFFKKTLHKYFSNTCPSFENKYLLFNGEEKKYFKSLDLYICTYFEESHSSQVLNYLYMTLMVEVRALKVYKLYQDLLKESKHPINISSILIEEENHLTDTEFSLSNLDKNFLKNKERLSQVEENLYKDLINKFSTKNKSNPPLFALH